MNALDAFFWRAAERGSARIRDTARGFDGGDREGHLIRACYGADGVAEHVFDDVRLIIEDEWTARLVAEGIALASALRYSRPDYAAMMDEGAAERPSLAPPGPLRARTLLNMVSALVWRTVAELRPCLTGEAKDGDGHKIVHAIPARVVDSLRLVFGDDLMACQALAAAVTQEATDYIFREGAPTRRPGDRVLAPNIADIATRATMDLADRIVVADGAVSMGPAQFDAWLAGAPSERLCSVLELAHTDSAIRLQVAYASLFLAVSKVALASQRKAAAGNSAGEGAPE